MKAEALQNNGFKYLVANGDIDSTSSVKTVLSKTGADGVMIGRAAQGNPWIFKTIRQELLGQGSLTPPTPREKITVIMEHLDGLIQLCGEAVAVREMRARLHDYIKGSHRAASSSHASSSFLYSNSISWVLQYSTI